MLAVDAGGIWTAAETCAPPAAEVNVVTAVAVVTDEKDVATGTDAEGMTAVVVAGKDNFLNLTRMTDNTVSTAVLRVCSSCV